MNNDIQRLDHTLSFLGFELAPRRRLLRRGEVEVRIGSRAFDLLCVLAGSAGQVVSGTTLLERAWRGRVVSESNLRVQMVALRRVVGQGHLLNVPGQGYLLTAPVEFRPASAAAR